MLLQFDTNLIRQEIYATGPELAQIMGLDRDSKGGRVYTYPHDQRLHIATLDNPVLVTDHYKICQLEPVKRDTVFALYASPVRITEYEGISLEFRQENYPGVWGPSIDTLLFCHALDRAYLHKIESAIEIGTGSGFISKYILKHAPNLKRIVLVDINPHAVACASEQILDQRAVFLHQDGIEALNQGQFDLIVCNPPYIPRPKSIDDNPYEGVGLLIYLLEQGSNCLKPGGHLVTNISSLCERAVEKAVHSIKILKQMEVPLKVFNVLNNAQWMDYLLTKQGLKEKQCNGYRFWHTISIVEIEKTITQP